MLTLIYSIRVCDTCKPNVRKLDVRRHKQNPGLRKVVEVRGDKVRLGIEAPREVTVHRREVYEKIKEDERQKETSHENPGSSE